MIGPICSRRECPAATPPHGGDPERPRPLTRRACRSQSAGSSRTAQRLPGEARLDPLTEAGSGSVQEKEKAWLKEIIAKVNALFEGALTDQDKLAYVNNVIKGKLLESKMLAQQAANNTKEQFSGSPDLNRELMNAIMSALEAHAAMSTQALNSDAVREGMEGHPA